jgi:hypothetical protein
MHATIDSEGNVIIRYNASEGHLRAPDFKMHIPCGNKCGALLTVPATMQQAACERCVCADGWQTLGEFGQFMLRWSDGRPAEVQVMVGLGGPKLDRDIKALVARMGWNVVIGSWSVGCAEITSCEPVKP